MDTSAVDLDAYLLRIGAPRPLAPSLDALARLQAAHVAAIPFENLDLLLGRGIRLDLESLQAKLVADRRGGYCFEHNTLFQAVLQSLGFAVTPLAARVRAGATAPRARTHMVLRVDLAEGPFVVDVGFGGDGPLLPVPLDEGREVWIGASGHRMRREGPAWVLEGDAGEGFSDLYVFTLEPQLPVDYEMANHFTSTHPSSSFLRTLTAQRSLPERSIVLRDRELRVREGRLTEVTSIRDPDHLLEVLARHFDLVLPPGTRFSKPEF
jgi:N-hydroxyarylamine O-acetyltransferase